MAGKFSDYLENEILDHVLKTGSWSRPANIYLALCDADPTDAGTGASISEPADGYARVDCTGDFGTVASARAIANDAAITFAEASGSWGTITHWAIVDSASGAGNMLAYGALSPNKAIGSGDNAEVAIGDLDISADSGGMSTYLANELLDHIFKGDAYSQPSGIYIAFADTTIVDATTGTTISEPAGGSYARVQDDIWDAAASGASENTNQIDSPTATASWGTITDVALIDASTVGNILFYAALDASKAIGVGDVLRLVAGALDITLD